MNKIIFILLSVFMISSTQSFGEMYSWKDKNGGLHFSNIPPPDEKELVDLKVSQEISYNASEDEERTEKLRARSKSVAKAPKTNKKIKKRKKNRSPGKVIVFSTVRCRYCVLAKAFLDKHNINYTDIDINTSKKGRERYNKLNGRGVPLILVGDKQIRGFNKSALAKALGL